MQVYIDGENCRKGLVRVLQDTGLIHNSREMTTYKLRELLVDVLNSDSGLEINYYASKIKLPHGYTPAADVMAHVNVIRQFTRQWVPTLERQGITYVKAGYLKVKSGTKCPNCGHVQDVLQEKGVDVRVATDVLSAAYTQEKPTIVLFSSDSDLIPALARAKEQGAKIIYVCFADYVNYAVSRVADETVSIPTEKVKKYFTAATS
jgi:uncharacterized LabA/DUF88 family protein